MKDEDYMGLALELARGAAQAGEIPVGAVMVQEGQIIARAGNQKENRQDATAHAEMLVLQQAAQHLGRWSLQDATLYCTLEPCVMCAGAMVNARLGRLVFGARDIKAGAAGSILDIARCPGLNHQIQVEFGVLEKACSDILHNFFMNLRRNTEGRKRPTRNYVI